MGLDPKTGTLLCTENFEFLYDNYQDYFLLQLEGGTRSGKTWAVSEFICWYLKNHTGKTITIARDKMTHLKKTLLLDFKIAMRAFGITSHINKTSMEFTCNGNIIRFVGINDDIMLAHGLTQDVLWVNECMSVSKDTMDQLEQRTKELMIIDYNPSASVSYVYDYPKQTHTAFKRTTIFDNPFAPKAAVRKVLSYEPTEKNKLLGTADKFKWEVYGLGRRCDEETIIYKQWDYFDRSKITEYNYRFIGLDFGYSQDPAAAIEVLIDGNNLYVSELIYETGLLNSQLADKLRPHLDRKTYIVADSAEPKSIAELNRLGLSTWKCVKGADSIRSGINKVKEYRLFINKKDVNLQLELQNYKWDKVKTGEYAGDILPKPVDKNNHLLDALRYAVTRFDPPNDKQA